MYICTMERRDKVFEWLTSHDIKYNWYEHPEAPTIEIARQYWHNDGSKHCKNLFFRNHKGNRHYLVVFDSEQSMAIHDLEQILTRANYHLHHPSVWISGWDCALGRYHHSDS